MLIDRVKGLSTNKHCYVLPFESGPLPGKVAISEIAQKTQKKLLIVFFYSFFIWTGEETIKDSRYQIGLVFAGNWINVIVQIL